MSDGSKAIINIEKIDLGNITQPATVLIEKISEAIGGIALPYQIEKVERAKAKAAKIKARSDIEITALQQRAMRRFIKEESDKQLNIESITRKSLPLLSDDATPQNIEKDWIVNYFDKAKMISDSEMQDMWSKILAGEANNPGSFSKRTVNLMSSLDKADAVMFNELCNYNWIVKQQRQPLIFELGADIYKGNGMFFSKLTHLDTIGLITFDTLAGFVFQQLPKKILASYHGSALLLEFAGENNNTLQIGHVMLTSVGQELARICTAEKTIGLEDYVINQWMMQGISVSCPYNHPPVE